MDRDFDAIVVGAGPAGSAAGYSMAKDGLSVLIIERGEYPGSKNMFGGRIYCKPIGAIFPNFWEEAPLERAVISERVSFLCGDASIGFRYDDPSFVDPVANSYTVLRSKFDRWMAKKAEDAGALIMNDTVVDDLIWHQGKVVGVKVRREEGEVYSSAVIIADGANSLLTNKMHADSRVDVTTFSLGIKELIALPQDVIDTRFNLSGNHGAAYLFVGGTDGVEGGGFIYTNRNSLSVGVVCNLRSLMKSQLKATEIIESFKKTPVVNELVKGGVIKEYSARLIPEGGFNAIPKLYAEGVLVAGSAAGLVINNGVTLRGVDLAIASGVAAANTVRMAKEKGDMTRSGLAKYMDLLREQLIIQDLETFKGAHGVMTNPYLYEVVPKLARDFGKRICTVGDGPQQKFSSIGKKTLKENTSVWKFLKWMLQVGRSL